MKVIIFGGSFNPPTIAHVFISCYILSAYKPEKIIVIPVYKHAFGKELESFEHRRKMCEMAMNWIPSVTISDIEKEIGGVSITARTIRLLKESNPNWNIKFVVGTDSANDLKAGRWKDSEALLQMAKPLIIDRSPTSCIFPHISSTEIRASLKGQLSEKIAKTFLPQNVLKYIEEQNLYKPLSYQKQKI